MRPSPDTDPTSAPGAGAPLPFEEGLSILDDALERAGALHRAGRTYGAFGAWGADASGPAPERDGGAGTPADRVFLAPERVAGRPPSPESDVWELGALAYRLLAGQPPVEEPDGETTSLAVVAPGVPLRLGDVVARMLAVDPARRPSAAVAGAAVHELREAVRQAGGPARPAPGPRAWWAGLVRRDPEPGDRAPGDDAAGAGGRSHLLLCLADFDPIARVPAPPLPAEPLQHAIDATLAQGLGATDLPTFPSIALEVLELARRDDVGAADLVRVIQRDPSLMARVLRVANSAYASRGIEVTSARDAVTRLGLREVIQLAAAAATRSLYAGEGAGSTVGATFRRLWLHAVACALASSWLATECRADAERAFLGGLLHDIGKTLALRGFATLVAGHRLRGLAPDDALAPVLEATHEELGLWLARSWALPASVVRACAEHHRPRTGPHQDRELYVVRLASAIVTLRLDPGWTPDRLREAQETAALLGLDRYRVRAAAAEIHAFAARAEALAGETD
jgi:putative nucleotidyltransferase with HDIG domain